MVPVRYVQPEMKSDPTSKRESTPFSTGMSLLHFIIVKMKLWWRTKVLKKGENPDDATHAWLLILSLHSKYVLSCVGPLAQSWPLLTDWICASSPSWDNAMFAAVVNVYIHLSVCIACILIHYRVVMLAAHCRQIDKRRDVDPSNRKYWIER